MSKRRRIHIYISDEDHERMDFLKAVRGTSLSAIVRAAVRAACHELGMETERRNFFKKSTTEGGP
jgi:hypothetical protein